MRKQFRVPLIGDTLDEEVALELTEEKPLEAVIA